jgi:hypothetical protein
MTEYLQALRRFWWVVVFGACAGLLIAIFMLYRVGLSFPPTLTARAQPSYTASTRLLVTSSTSPLLRTSEPQIETLPSGGGSDQSALPPDVSGPPNLTVLIQAANVYPVLIQSDQVTALRTKMFGPIPGSVSAQALFAVFRPFGGFVRSDFPVIEITAVSASPNTAVQLASATERSFIRWLGDNQERAHVRPNERVLLQELQAPRLAGAVGGPSYGLPILAGFALLLAFGVLAVLLERISTHEYRRDRVPGLRPVALPATTRADSAAAASSCVNCGNELAANARFCSSCGYAREQALSASAPAPEQPRQARE